MAQTVVPYKDRPRLSLADRLAGGVRGVVYFITDGVAIKIGVTSGSAEGRMSILQNSHYNRLRLLASVPGDEAYERRIHAKFKRLRIKGEWFRDEPELRDFIASLDAEPEDVPPLEYWG